MDEFDVFMVSVVGAVKVVGSGVCTDLAASHAHTSPIVLCVRPEQETPHTSSHFRPSPPMQDAINRRVATETLLEAAYEGHSRQHIFLTPQDIQVGVDGRVIGGGGEGKGI